MEVLKEDSKWYGHIRRQEEHIGRNMLAMKPSGRRDILKRRYMDSLKKDLIADEVVRTYWEKGERSLEKNDGGGSTRKKKRDTEE